MGKSGFPHAGDRGQTGTWVEELSALGSCGAVFLAAFFPSRTSGDQCGHWLFVLSRLLLLLNYAQRWNSPRTVLIHVGRTLFFSSEK